MTGLLLRANDWLEDPRVSNFYADMVHRADVHRSLLCEGSLAYQEGLLNAHHTVNDGRNVAAGVPRGGQSLDPTRFWRLVLRPVCSAYGTKIYLNR